MTRRAPWLAVLLALLLATAACGGGTNTIGGGQTGGKVVKGGIFRVGSLNTIDSLNPYVAFNENAYVTFVETYPVLVEYNDDLSKLVGDWASSWETSSDGKVWTFHLKPGKWSDGTPLTADDAVWTCETDIKYASGPAAVHAVFITHAVKCEAPDPQTLVITYEKAVANVLPQLQQWFVLPKHVWSKYTGHNGKDLKTYKPESQLPIVGAGPFIVEKYDKNGTTIFRKNPDSYYGEPNVDAVGLQIFQNTDAMVSALRAGELDYVDALPSNVVKEFQGNSKFTVTKEPGLQINDFIFNSNPKKPPHRELLNPQVREAFAHAIDKQQIADVVFAGNAKPVTSIIAPLAGKWMNPNLPDESFDIAKANSILDQLGYAKGSDGVRVAEGHKMQYDIITPTSLEGINRAFEIVQNGLRQAGVKVTQKALDDTTAFEDIGAPDFKYEKFDLAMWDWVGYLDPDFMLSVVTCAQYGGWSDSGYCNKRYDQMYSQQQLTPNQDKRRVLVWKMQAYLYKQRPYIWLAAQDHVWAVAKSWGGLVASPQGPFNSISKLSLTRVHQQ
jgi:peptide/nickel transport system substrate-binding protein